MLACLHVNGSRGGVDIELTFFCEGRKEKQLDRFRRRKNTDCDHCYFALQHCCSCVCVVVLCSGESCLEWLIKDPPAEDTHTS